jgi:hypothetical protein
MTPVIIPTVDLMRLLKISLTGKELRLEQTTVFIS